MNDLEVAEIATTLPRLEMPAPQLEFFSGEYFALAAYSAESPFIQKHNFEMLATKLGGTGKHLTTVCLYIGGETVIELLLLSQKAPEQIKQDAAEYYEFLRQHRSLDYDAYKEALDTEFADCWSRWTNASRMRVLATNGLSTDLALSKLPPQELRPIFERHINKCPASILTMN